MAKVIDKVYTNTCIAVIPSARLVEFYRIEELAV
jgi:hypothetical protein